MSLLLNIDAHILFAETAVAGQAYCIIQEAEMEAKISYFFYTVPYRHTDMCMFLKIFTSIPALDPLS